MNQRIILKPDEIVACPECGHEFALRDGIARQTIERYEEEYDSAIAAERKALEEILEKQADKRAQKAFGTQVEELRGQLEEEKAGFVKLQSQVNQAKEKAAADARAEADTQALQLKHELHTKNQKIAEYRAQELELRQEKQALEDARQDLELQVQRRMDAEKKRIEEKTAETYRFREAEYKKKIEDAQKSNDELKRKLEQGSQQLQGEVLELEIEELLRTAFPLDKVEPVRKGQRGADVHHTVRLRSGAECGTIIWETKRAENWSNSWIPKLKDDQQEAGGELAVLVSSVLPAGVTEQMVLVEGVWLVTPSLVKPMAEVLRTVLVESHRQKAIASGKGEKMEMLYNYICSAQFAQKVRATVDAYQQMREDLEKEKAAMQRLWKKREGQLERITVNIMGMCGELQGAAENGLPQLDDVAMLMSDSN